MRALPIAASGVTTAFQRQAVTAHNTANVQTAGFNTDLAQEAVSSNVNVRSLQASVKTFQAADEMFRTVIDMKA